MHRYTHTHTHTHMDTGVCVCMRACVWFCKRYLPSKTAWDAGFVSVPCRQVAQATAHALGIPLDLVKVRPNQSLIANNAMVTGGSTTSEQCVYVSVVISDCYELPLVISDIMSWPRWTVCLCECHHQWMLPMNCHQWTVKLCAGTSEQCVCVSVTVSDY